MNNARNNTTPHSTSEGSQGYKKCILVVWILGKTSEKSPFKNIQIEKYGRKKYEWKIGFYSYK